MSTASHSKMTIRQPKLAVDKAWQGRGIGPAPLAYALRVAVEGADSIASAVIGVDDNDDTARSFYARFGFRSPTDDRLHLYLPMETAGDREGVTCAISRSCISWIAS